MELKNFIHSASQKSQELLKNNIHDYTEMRFKQSLMHKDIFDLFEHMTDAEIDALFSFLVSAVKYKIHKKENTSIVFDQLASDLLNTKVVMLDRKKDLFKTKDQIVNERLYMN